jgi:hypothetical protein
MKWTRVTRSVPCAICLKTDWCAFSEIGSYCMRVESPHPVKSGGWLHLEKKPQFVPPPQKQQPVIPEINAAKLISEWAKETPAQWLESFAASLGVSAHSLAALNAAYAKQHRAWAFPMSNGHGQAVGIRLRSNDGRKWAVRGSKQGIFIPNIEPQRRLFVCEGPTDTAAALSMGLFAVGRPSCQGGNHDVLTLCVEKGIREVVIVSDNDEPGLNGARKLASELPTKTITYTPPAKDLREFYRSGGARIIIESELKNFLWFKK